MPTLASGRVSLGCYELISAMLVKKPLLVGRTILKQAGGVRLGTYHLPRCGKAAVNFPVHPQLPSAPVSLCHTQSISPGFPGDTGNFAEEFHQFF